MMKITTSTEDIFDENLTIVYSSFLSFNGLCWSAKTNLLKAIESGKKADQLFHQSEIQRGLVKTLEVSYYCFKALAYLFSSIPLFGFWIVELNAIVFSFSFTLFIIFLVDTLILAKDLHLDKSISTLFFNTIKINFLALPIFVSFTASCLFTILFPTITKENNPFLQLTDYWLKPHGPLKTLNVYDKENNYYKGARIPLVADDDLMEALKNLSTKKDRKTVRANTVLYREI